MRVVENGTRTSITFVRPRGGWQHRDRPYIREFISINLQVYIFAHKEKLQNNEPNLFKYY